MSHTNELLLFATVAVAGLLHGISGMGFAMITIAAISGTYSLSQAVVLVLLPTALLNLTAWLAGKEGGQGGVWQNFCHYLRHYWQLAALSLAGAMLGVYLLLWLNQAYLLLMLALVVLWYAASSLLGRPIVLANTRSNMIVMGFLGGVVGGATNAMAPVMMMYLLSISDDKHTVIRVGNLCFFVGKLAQFIVLFGAFRQLDLAGWGQIVTIAVVAFVFMRMGASLSRLLPVKLFRRMILWLLLVLGLRLAYFGWVGVMGMG